MNDREKVAELLRFIRALVEEFHPVLPDSEPRPVMIARLDEGEWIAAMNRLGKLERGEWP